MHPTGNYWEYDNLNRMTKSYPLEDNTVPAVSWTYEHDILGNRIRRNATTDNYAYPMRYDWGRAITSLRRAGSSLRILPWMA